VRAGRDAYSGIMQAVKNGVYPCLHIGICFARRDGRVFFQQFAQPSHARARIVRSAWRGQLPCEDIKASVQSHRASFLNTSGSRPLSGIQIDPRAFGLGSCPGRGMPVAAS